MIVAYLGDTCQYITLGKTYSTPSDLGFSVYHHLFDQRGDLMGVSHPSLLMPLEENIHD